MSSMTNTNDTGNTDPPNTRGGNRGGIDRVTDLPDTPQRREADRVADTVRAQGYDAQRKDYPPLTQTDDCGWRHYVIVHTADGGRYEGQTNDRRRVFTFTGGGNTETSRILNTLSILNTLIGADR